MSQKKKPPDPETRIQRFEEAWAKFEAAGKFEKYGQYGFNEARIKMMHDKMVDWLEDHEKQGNKVYFSRFIRNWIWGEIEKNEKERKGKGLPLRKHSAKGGRVQI